MLGRMKGPEITSTVEDTQSVSVRAPVPVVMVAHAPPRALKKDRCQVQDGFTVGRDSQSDLMIRDKKISGCHLRISVEGEHASIEDLGSTNGTYLQGKRLTQKERLRNNSVIRIGETVLVYHGDGEDCLVPPPTKRYGMVGEFHVASILKKVVEAVFSTEHLLITGPTGSGKELVAKAIHAMISRGQSSVPFVTHNAACFTNDDEATSTLLGIASRAFTSVDKRPGLIEQAEGGVLFLDEIHNYSARVQRSLLRIIEDKKFSRIGETVSRVADVRFLLASNDPQSIAPDLLGRLRQSLALSPLSERRADIPGIFNHILKTKLESYGISEKPIHAHLKGRHYELMCLDGFLRYNVRGIRQVADIIATKIGTGTPTEATIDRVFSEAFPEALPLETPGAESPVIVPTAPSHDHKPAGKATRSKYEKNRALIIEQFKDRDGNLSSTARALERRGLSCSRRHLREYLKKWGIIS